MSRTAIARFPLRLGAFSLTSLVAVSAAALLVVSAGSAQAATSVPLGTAGSFVVLAGAGITNTGPTTLNGDLGTFPTTSISGPGSLTVTGTNHGGDAVTQGAKSDLVTAYNNAAGQGPTTPIAADLAGQTLTPGVYNSASSVGLSGALTLDAGGDPNAVFVFQAGSTLTTASGSIVNLVNGAQSCNVYWQVGSSATLGTGSAFRGSILALTSITLTTAATVEGRVLARNGAVTLDSNTVSSPECSSPSDYEFAGGVGEIDAAAAAALAAPPNPNENLNAFVVVDPITGQRTFDNASWVTVVSTQASWTTASWTTASWTTASWTTASWTTASWTTASWTTASWTTASWTTASWPE